MSILIQTLILLTCNPEARNFTTWSTANPLSSNALMSWNNYFPNSKPLLKTTGDS